MPRSESTEQTMLVNRVRQFYPWAMIFAIPNGGYREPKEAARLKSEGVLAGVPDLCMPVPYKESHGLYIEMKRADGGRTSTEQDKVIAYLRKAGYTVEVCHGVEEAWDCVCNYLHNLQKVRMAHLN